MYFRGVGTATPTAGYTKAECLDAFQRSDWFARLDTRRLAVDSLDEAFQIDPNTLAQRFRQHAPTLAIQAGQRALDDAPDGWWWLSSFGAGFSCHGALLKVH